MNSRGVLSSVSDGSDGRSVVFCAPGHRADVVGLFVTVSYLLLSTCKRSSPVHPIVFIDNMRIVCRAAFYAKPSWCRQDTKIVRILMLACGEVPPRGSTSVVPARTLVSYKVAEDPDSWVPGTYNIRDFTACNEKKKKTRDIRIG